MTTITEILAAIYKLLPKLPPEKQKETLDKIIKILKSEDISK